MRQHALDEMDKTNARFMPALSKARRLFDAIQNQKRPPIPYSHALRALASDKKARTQRA